MVIGTSRDIAALHPVPFPFTSNTHIACEHDSCISFHHQLSLSHFCPDVLFARHLIRCSRLITLCIPYPLNVRSTEAALLGRKDRLRGVTLLGLTIRCTIPLRTKPLISARKLVCMYQQDKAHKVLISTAFYTAQGLMPYSNYIIYLCI